jgi:uncharacterized lipoprotein YmbA
MKPRPLIDAALILLGALALSACASQADHFYLLDTLPGADGGKIRPTSRPVRLNLTVPGSFDRAEMVLNDAANGVVIYDHERWPAPLAGEITATLARDIEQRRADLLIGDSRFDRAGSTPLDVDVAIVQITARRGGQVILEAHWRIADQIGGDSFKAPVDGPGFAAVAHGYSQALSELADTLAAAIPDTAPPRSALK